MDEIGAISTPMNDHVDQRAQLSLEQQQEPID
jgi:hypothetical protein